jgi:hypothetical protein
MTACSRRAARDRQTFVSSQHNQELTEIRSAPLAQCHCPALLFAAMAGPQSTKREW